MTPAHRSRRVLHRIILVAPLIVLLLRGGMLRHGVIAPGSPTLELFCDLAIVAFLAAVIAHVFVERAIECCKGKGKPE